MQRNFEAIHLLNQGYAEEAIARLDKPLSAPLVGAAELREEGLDSCPQEAWAVYSRQIRETVAIPDDHIFFCGLAIGHRDPAAPVNAFAVSRAPLGEVARFVGF